MELLSTTIWRDDVEICVEFYYEPGTDSTWDCPGSGEDISIVCAREEVEDIEVELTPSEIEHVYRTARSTLEDHCYQGPEDDYRPGYTYH